MLKKLKLLLLVSALVGWQTFAASSLDLTFNVGSGANGIVEQVLPLPSGKILICGNFTTFNGVSRPYIARLNSDGSVDPTFVAAPSYWVRNMSVQPDGKIIIGGFFTSVARQSRNLIARLHPDGAVDSSFNPGTGCRDIIAGGIDGNIDPFVFWTAVQPDGKILATGNFRNYNGASSVGLVRINPDGSRDTTFNVGGGLNSWGRHILVMPNGQILVSGWFTWYNNKSCNRLARINSNGLADTGFNPFFGDKTAIYSTALVANNKIIAAGHSLNEEGLFKREMARLNPDGSFDESFVGKTNEKTESVVVQPDGKVIVVGNFSSVNDQPQGQLARFFPDGQVDSSLRASIDNFVWSAALQSDGKLLISGGFWTVDGQSRVGVARLNTGIVPGQQPDPAPILSATASSHTQVVLNWSDTSPNRTGYVIERKIGAGGVYQSIATANSSLRTFTDNNASPATGYYYRLRGNTSGGTPTYSNEAGVTTPPAPGSGSSTVTFVGVDSDTQGTWKGIYGADGYVIVNDATRLPSYVTAVTPSGKSDWTWNWSTTDVRGLQRANASDRLLACWYETAYSINIGVNDSQTHRLAMYFVDADTTSRSQKVELWDGSNGALLNSQTLSGFNGGKWLTYDFKGPIRVTITKTAGGNGVISGLFFGGGGGGSTVVATPVFSPAGGTFAAPQSVTISSATPGAEIRYTTNGEQPTTGSPLYTAPISVTSSTTLKAKAYKSGLSASTTASATYTITSSTGGGTGGTTWRYLGMDSATKGNWSGKFGADGYTIVNKASKPASYASTAASGSAWTWNDPTPDTRALLYPASTSRIASCWYASSSFTIDVNLTGSQARKVSVYCLDFDSAGRSQTIELLDAASGAVLHSITLSGFAGGQYLSWDVKIPVKIRVTKVAGSNCVVSGIFLDPASAAL